VLRSRRHGDIPVLPQYAFMAWRSVKAQGQFYLYLYLTKLNDNKTTHCRNTNQKVRQGCPLSPTLFNVYTSEIIIHWNQLYSYGIEINDDSLLLFADEQVLLPCSEDYFREHYILCRTPKNSFNGSMITEV
jgi:hypothetical protein